MGQFRPPVPVDARPLPANCCRCCASARAASSFAAVSPALPSVGVEDHHQGIRDILGGGDFAVVCHTHERAVH